MWGKNKMDSMGSYITVVEKSSLVSRAHHSLPAHWTEQLSVEFIMSRSFQVLKKSKVRHPSTWQRNQEPAHFQGWNPAEKIQIHVNMWWSVSWTAVQSHLEASHSGIQLARAGKREDCHKMEGSGGKQENIITTTAYEKKREERDYRR